MPLENCSGEREFVSDVAILKGRGFVVRVYRFYPNMETYSKERWEETAGEEETRREMGQPCTAKYMPAASAAARHPADDTQHYY